MGRAKSAGTNTEQSSMASSQTRTSQTRVGGGYFTISLLVTAHIWFKYVISYFCQHECRWKGEDDVDEETLRIYKQLELRDRRRWTVADRNKNLQLSKEEFAAFIHPEHAEHMGDILISETMADFDQDGDGKLDLAEYDFQT